MQAQRRVALLQAELDAITSAFNKATAAQHEAEARATELAHRLDCANRLIASLTGEGGRWKARLVDLEESADSAIGAALVSAAFVSYAGSFDSESRAAILQRRWLPSLKQLHVPCRTGAWEAGRLAPCVVLPTECACWSPGANILGLLSTPSQLEEWTSQGLPADRASKENALIMTRALR